MPTSALVEDELLYLNAGWQAARDVSVVGQDSVNRWIDWVVLGRGALFGIATARNLGQSEVDDLLMTTGYRLLDTASAMPAEFDRLLVVIEGAMPAGGHAVTVDLPERGDSLSVVYASNLLGTLEEIDSYYAVRGRASALALEQLLTASELVVGELTHC